MNHNAKLMAVILIGFGIICFQFITAISEIKAFSKRVDKVLERIEGMVK